MEDATLTQMNARLGGTEARLTSIEARLDATASTALVIGVGVWLTIVISLVSWLTR